MSIDILLLSISLRWSAPRLYRSIFFCAKLQALPNSPTIGEFSLARCFASAQTKKCRFYRHHFSNGAGDGNRTRITSLEGWCSTTELHLHCSGGPYEIRTRDLLRDRETCWTATPMVHCRAPRNISQAVISRNRKYFYRHDLTNFEQFINYSIPTKRFSDGSGRKPVCVFLSSPSLKRSKVGML